MREEDILKGDLQLKDETQLVNDEKEEDKTTDDSPKYNLETAFLKVIPTLEEKFDKAMNDAGGVIPIKLADILHDLNEFESKLDEPRKCRKMTNKFRSIQIPATTPEYMIYHWTFTYHYATLKYEYQDIGRRSPIIDAKFKLVYAKMVKTLISVISIDLTRCRGFNSLDGKRTKRYAYSLIKTAKSYLCVMSGTLHISDIFKCSGKINPIHLLLNNSRYCCRCAGYVYNNEVLDILVFAGKME